MLSAAVYMLIIHLLAAQVSVFTLAMSTIGATVISSGVAYVIHLRTNSGSVEKSDASTLFNAMDQFQKAQGVIIERQDKIIEKQGNTIQSQASHIAQLERKVAGMEVQIAHLEAQVGKRE